MPGHIYLQGRIGVVGRSGTLGYEAAEQMKELGIGISTSVGIGGDPINGSSFKDALELFEQDDGTDAVLMIGEIGGPQEAEAAEFARTSMRKPVAAYIAGLSAPKGRKMGHAGAIISAFGESAPEKVEILREAGVTIAPTPAELGSTVAAMLSRGPAPCQLACHDRHAGRSCRQVRSGPGGRVRPAGPHRARRLRRLPRARGLHAGGRAGGPAPTCTCWSSAPVPPRRS